MADAARPSTPPRTSAPKATDMTPEQVRRMEESRLKAKAIRQQQQVAEGRKTAENASGYPVTSTAGQKRAHSSITSSRDAPPTKRDARKDSDKSRGIDGLSGDTDIRVARKFQKYVEYDFSKMTDTKGGFMTHEDDPFNKALHAPDAADKPANMTLKEWERQQLQKRLRERREGPYEPGLSVLDKREITKKCQDCGSLEIDWQWDELLKCQVCHTCKEKLPEKYSLLTKTEAKEDYLLTDPELRDESLLPHLEKPNPHKSTWNNMMLYLRFQVEAYAFSKKKWGSAAALDEEFERRQKEGKDRKEKKFRNKLEELKKRTRVEAYKRGRKGGGGEFGDVIGGGRHVHEWGRQVEDPETGMLRRRCAECGMEVEEMEL
ncbi:DNA repair protein rad14 [Recurvomyces mirabilis]|uniref:DNA repair protein RAD14 n=2 Tax=Recurvomyces mirabilis TaxID=574656 RepID=A0AAE0WR43_9PEZI|nr:DNA repair protein rad14 [Recurvomyces mirabilis]